MKLLGYLLSVIALFIMVFLCTSMQSMIVYLFPLYLGVLIYLLFKSDWDHRKYALKKVFFIGMIITAVLIVESLILRELANKFSALATGSSGVQTSNLLFMFPTPSLTFVISLGLVFVAVPPILCFLEGLTPPDTEGFMRNPYLIFVYVFLTLGFYQICWFFLGAYDNLLVKVFLF